MGAGLGEVESVGEGFGGGVGNCYCYLDIVEGNMDVVEEQDLRQGLGEVAES